MIDEKKVDYNPGILYGPTRDIIRRRKEYGIAIIEQNYVTTLDITKNSYKNAFTYSFYTVLGICTAEKVNKIIIAHNHPNGICLASEKDVCSANQLKEFLADFNIRLLDFVIVTSNDMWSIAEHNWKYLSSKDVSNIK